VDNLNEYDMSYEACLAREKQRRLWSIEDWLLREAGNPEEAKRLAQYLTTVDWDQTIIRQRSDEARYEAKEKQKYEEAVHKGGGHCESCKKLTDEFYIFEHTINRYGENIEYAIDGEKLCLACLMRLEKRMHVDVDEWHDTCERCRDVFKTKELYTHQAIPNNYRGYCKACFDILVEQTSIVCSVCHTKVLEHVVDDVCNDCYKKYPDRSSVNSHLTRAIEAGTPATLTLPQWQTAVEYFTYKCAYCGIKPYQVLEHYVPIIRSGGTTADNCLPACKTCNGRKGIKHPNEFEYLFPTANIARIKAYFASLTV
jgi:5-methylcytosine-specific restriction endonuclease McrA